MQKERGRDRERRRGRAKGREGKRERETETEREREESETVLPAVALQPHDGAVGHTEGARRLLRLEHRVAFVGARLIEGSVPEGDPPARWRLRVGADALGGDLAIRVLVSRLLLLGVLEEQEARLRQAHHVLLCVVEGHFHQRVAGLVHPQVHVRREGAQHGGLCTHAHTKGGVGQGKK